MAKSKEPADSHDASSAGANKGSLVKKIVIIVIILGLVTGAAGGAWFFLFNSKTPSLDQSKLPPEIKNFTTSKMPDLFASLVLVNEEADMTSAEIERITKVGDTYPDQKTLVDNEKKSWEANLATLTKGIEGIEKDIAAIYVLTQVNPEEGQKLLESKMETLKQQADSLVTASKALTDKIRANQPKQGIIQKITSKFTKK
jgi:flagellar basal body-associated protein FliL